MGSERDWTAGLQAWFAGVRDAELGIGDDAAIVRAAGRIVVACDPVVVSVHCTEGTPARAIGRKAILRNVSDLAAMGAVPTYAVCSVLLPREFGDEARAALFEGLRDAAREHGCQVIGGDTGNTPGPCTVAVTMLGELVGTALLRSNARVGDALYVSGPLGGSILGRHLEPEPRVALGKQLANHPGVGGVLDVSDGLLLDLWTMLEASAVVGAELDRASIPVHGDALELSAESGRAPLDHALLDGEDHELLFTMREEAVPLDGCVRIGRLVSAPGLWLLEADGTRVQLEAKGFEHDV